MSIKKKLHHIIASLVSPQEGDVPVTGISICDHFRPGEIDDASVARNLVASFLIRLSGPAMPRFEEAGRYLEGMRGSRWNGAAEFLSAGIELTVREIEERYEQDERFKISFNDLYDHIVRSGSSSSFSETISKIWMAFFPEGIIEGDLTTRVADLRAKRKIMISSLNTRPIQSPEREVLFASNILLTIPRSDRIAGADGDPNIREALRCTAAEEQISWYDHPVPVGVPLESNEAVYGLRNLSDAVLYEEQCGGKEPGRNIDCVLSVSVTHPGLHAIARPWLRSELARAGGIRGINLYLFTEEDTKYLMNEILLPAARRYIAAPEEAPLREVFGVDGEYGRHYSFLKAMARFWNVFISPEIRATFKVDLDQVFPQEALVRETGASAFGHMRSPLWGARGIDSLGRDVYLGLIAGALVNRKDIGASLFTPDVAFPGIEPTGDEVIFRSTVPQALSTETEMMTRYGDGCEFDGRSTCLQRVHVTGGTSGILVDALKEYRPFTPTIFGRAEDQAYLLSVLFKSGGNGYLRYAHEPGLFMRHDADLFADAAAAARTGKILGDYVRMLFFTGYAHALPWPLDRIKDAVDPFTGCFISRIPITIVLSRFALKTALLFAGGEQKEGLRFFTDGLKRLSGTAMLNKDGNIPLVEIFSRERRGWDLYYDVLDIVEKHIAERDHFALELADRAKQIINSLGLNQNS